METLNYYKQQAMHALQSNQLDVAEQWLIKARTESNDDLEVLRLSAMISGQLGRYEETISYCERALALNPEDPTAWTFLGNARIANDEYDRALEALDRAESLAPEAPMILTNRGNALFLLNRHEEAIACLKRAIQLAPDSANAYYNLGRVYKTLGNFVDAAAQFELAIKYNPGLVDAYTNLSGIYFALGRLVEAERVTRDAIARHPANFGIRNYLATLYMSKGELDEALREIELILEHEPDNVLAISNKAALLEHRGNFKQAHELVTTLARENRLIPCSAEVYAKLCHRFDECEEAGNHIRKLLEREKLDENKRDLHFALGRICNRMERYREALEHYTKGNRLSCIKYDVNVDINHFNRLINFFSKDSLENIPVADNESELPVFIVGMPRSGTSLTEQILSSHPAIHGAGELVTINRLLKEIRRVTGGHSYYPECVSELDSEGLSRLANTYLSELRRHSADALRVTDKMPGNFRNLGLISRLFPKARIIHCIRDPRDTCLSIFFQNFNHTHAYGADLSTLGKYYRAYEKLMAHWRKVIDIPIYEIHYADMVADQEKYSRELVEFCGLEWDERCLDFHKIRRDVITASYDQVRRPIYKSSLERWRHYEPYILPLLEALETTSESR